MVSVIMPAYNAGRFIEQSILSVVSQTYTDWELIVVDDCSTDNTAEIVQRYARKDNRIKYSRRDSPSGSPSMPRNEAIMLSKGRYIAFLDSDDVWLPDKMQHQLALFSNPDAAIVFSDYRKMDEDGNVHSRAITAPPKITYRKLLQNNYLGCLTVVYDTQKVGKVLFEKKGHEDYILWLSILKKGFSAYNTCSVEAIYRVGRGSVSANKFKVLKWTWDIYRNDQELGIASASYYFAHYAIKSMLKYLK